MNKRRLDSPYLKSSDFPGFPASAPRTCISAFDCIADAEAAAVNAFNQSGGKDDVTEGHIVASRVLGCLFYVLHNRHTSFSETAADAICRELYNDTKRNLSMDSLVYELGARYRDLLLRGFRTSTTPAPQTPQHPSQPSFDTIEEKYRAEVIAASISYDTAREKTLARDGYRCKIIQQFNSKSCKEIREVDRMALEEHTGRGLVEVCHIVNESLTQHVDDDAGSIKRESGASFLGILTAFGMESIATMLSEANGVHSLSNLLCLTSGLQYEFDNLDVWFEPTETPHVYTVHCAVKDIAVPYRHWKNTVTFDVFMHRYVGFKNAELDLPDPRLLTLHGICARVAHMSGAAEYLDKIDREMEALTVLASDGSTSTAFFESILAPYVAVQ